MKKAFLLFALAGTAAFYARGQSVGPATINAAGGGATIGTNEFEWSVGEMSLVSTFSGASIVVTQGVLHPHDGPPLETASTPLSRDLVVFPNPATTTVNIRYSSQADCRMAYRLFDAAGKLISTRTFDARQGVTIEQVNVAALANATYMLEVIVDPGTATQKQATYTIQKLK